MSVTPDFIGQIYRDTNTGNLWRANSLTPGDWTLELQNLKLTTSPPGTSIARFLSVFPTWPGGNNFPGVTDLHIGTDKIVTIQVSNADDLATIDANSLTEFVGGEDAFFQVTFCQDLQSVTLPLAVTLPPGDGTYYATDISANAVLATINLPVWVPDNGSWYSFSTNALSAASVNNILARCVAAAGFVSGNLALDGGTNSAPTDQGILDKATLIGRGVTVTTN